MLSTLRSLALILSSASILMACSPSQSSDENPEVEENLVSVVPVDSIDSFVEVAIQEFLSTTPQAVGISVGVVFNDEVFTYHYGTTAPGSQESPTGDTIYGIASITKTFTGVLLARATIDGKLKLDDDIRDYLDDDYPNLEKDGHPIRVAQLVNHTSGLPNSLPDRPEMYPDYPGYQGNVPRWIHRISEVFADYSTEDFFADLHTISLDTIPGTQFSYSNASSKLAGYLLERVYNRPYEALVDSFVLQPLNMNNTGITFESEKLNQLVTGYDETGEAMPPSLNAYGAAGALKSSIVDLSRYAQWHLNERDAIVRLSHTPPDGQARDPEEGYALGLNWQMIRSNGLRRIWQDGNIPGYSSRVVLYPELNMGVVILANQLDRSIPQRIERLADSILESLDEQTFTLMEGL